VARRRGRPEGIRLGERRRLHLPVVVAVVALRHRRLGLHLLDLHRLAVVFLQI
jgi:hypothetical protein